MTSIGIFAPDAPGDMRDLHEVEAHMGRPADIVSWFSKWSQPFRQDHMRAVLEHGATPMLTWEPWDVTLRDVIAGKHDGIIRQFGHDSRRCFMQYAHDETVYLRLAHEQNGRGWYPWQVDGGVYRAAWERIVTLIENRAPQFEPVWCVNKHYDGAPRIVDFWPGGHLVSAVGIDSYNMPHVVGRWREPDELFSETVDQIRAFWDGPIGICETGCVQDPRRPAWLESLKRWSIENGIEFVCYFNAVGASGDYQLTSDELRILGDDLGS